MTLSIHKNLLVIDGTRVQMPWPVLDAVETENTVFVLLDPNSYLKDEAYLDSLRRGGSAIKNLIALRKNGMKLWDADLPEHSDYYYKIISSSPLVANSFSSYRCEIDPEDGSIKEREFFK